MLVVVDICNWMIVHGSNELRICKGKIVQGDLMDDSVSRTGWGKVHGVLLHNCQKLKLWT